jgi:hypothetical protein
MTEENHDFHYWIGSSCREKSPSNSYPQKVVAVSDIITIMDDTHTQPPDRSWMLYLLEFFLDNREVPAELDLICAFDDDGTFNAVFGGHNQHEFTLPTKVGHSYIREIIGDPVKHSISYNIGDLNTGESESFQLNNDTIKDKEDIFDELQVNKMEDIMFEGSDQFSGVEWHNKVNDEPFPIRYHTVNSLLQYGNLQSNESKYITYRPYRSLIPDKDTSAAQYPITFENVKVIKGCICYNTKSGNSNNGLNFNF